jgi:hypothetical protein
MPDLASGVQQSVTIIEIRPYRGGWQCFEGPGVGPYWTGESGKEDAIGYATARAKFGAGRDSCSRSQWQGPDNYPLNKNRKP